MDVVVRAVAAAGTVAISVREQATGHVISSQESAACFTAIQNARAIEERSSLQEQLEFFSHSNRTDLNTYPGT